jgi:hypothetical protein
MCERRPRSNTPVQALVTLNDPAFIAAANGLARRLVAEGGASAAQRLTHAFHCCLARPPAPGESHPLLRLYEESRRRFKQDLSAARALLSVGFPKVESDADLPELAAWAVVANVLLNLDEALTKG